MKKPPDLSQPCLHSLITILNRQFRRSILINIEDFSSFSSSFARFTRFKYLFKLKNCLCRFECQSHEPEIGYGNKASRAMAEHLQRTVMAFYRVASKSDGKNQPFRRKDEDGKILELSGPDLLLLEDNRRTTSTNSSFEVKNSVSDFLSKKQALMFEMEWFCLVAFLFFVAVYLCFAIFVDTGCELLWSSLCLWLALTYPSKYAAVCFASPISPMPSSGAGWEALFFGLTCLGNILVF